MDCNLETKRKPLILLAAFISVVLFGVGFWAQTQYAQGNDPLAQVRSLFVTVEQSEQQAIIPQANEEDLEEEQSLAQTEESLSQTPHSADAGVAVSDGAPDDVTPSTPQQPSGAHSSQEDQAPSQSPAPSTAMSVSISIDPGETGIAGGSAQLTLSAGSTVYDALMACGVSVNAQQTAMGVYVAAINGLAEKDYGPTSGWTYLVNGSMPQHACNFHELHDGDSIVWRYVNVEK